MILTGTDLEKTYTLPHKTIHVLKGASLAVAPQERVAIVGKSGAGKSTLLHLLGGLDKPQRGTVSIQDHDIYALSSLRRTRLRAAAVGFVFQSYHLLPEMDLIENVMLPAMAVGKLTRKQMRTRALDLLDQVGLAERATHTPLELSGGEQQRAALARALMNNPPLLLADEPTGNLDKETGAHVMKLLFGLTREGGHALVMVTHAPDVAALCDHTLTLQDGQLIQA